MIRHLALTTWLAAAALFAAPPLLAQTALEAAEAASARLDFATALSLLAAEIDAAPAAPEARLVRAALHRQMNRPALALDDLAAVLAAEPANVEALHARGDLLLALGAYAPAAADFDALLEAAPDDVAALIARARARAGFGLRTLAGADLDRASALAPEAPGLAEARAALRAPAAVAASFDPAALMSPEFRVTEGAAEASHEVVIVHAGNDLAREAALVPRAPLAAALTAGAVQVTHLFTYTGDDSAIWANLALICAGPEGFAATAEALATPEARAALDDIDAGRGREAFDTLVTAAYGAAGLAPERARDCAFSRGKALAYLTEWTARRDSITLEGTTLYDRWPLYVFDGAPVAPSALRETLAALAPDDSAPTVAHGSPPELESAPPGGMVLPGATPVLRPRAAALTPVARPGPKSALPVQVEIAPPPRAEPPAPLSPIADAPESPAAPALPEGFGPVDPEASLPAELRGIWAPSLVDCIAYTDAIAAPSGLDTALPRLNPLDGPPIGTVLITSQRMRLFNATGTECTLVSVTESAEDGTPWAARLACVNAIAPDVVVPLVLTRLEGTGPAPRFAAVFGPHEGIELLQCRQTGALGRDFAALWDSDEASCSLRAPVAGAVFTFTAGTEGLVLTITPETPPDGIASSRMVLSLDGEPLASGGGSGENGWRIPLGPFAAASERLAFGLLLDARAFGPDGAPVWSRRLPLLGSTRALATLDACAPSP